MFDVNSGSPARVPSGNIGFGIRADEVWELINLFAAKPISSPRKIASRKPVFLRHYPDLRYIPFPVNWDGTVIRP